MGAPRILVVEDDDALAEGLLRHLRRAGFEVERVADGDEARAMSLTGFDLAVLDLMLPGTYGLDVLKAWRARGDDCALPVVLLTARDHTADKVRGLSLGADDYVTKPFSPRELVSRVKANLRRAKASTSASTEDPIRVGDLEVDPAARTVMRDGESVNLTYSEFEILLKLLKSPRRVFTREELMDHLWKGSFYGDLRSVDVHVRHLRQKIERDPANPVLIRTVRGVGYAFGREDGPAE